MEEIWSSKEQAVKWETRIRALNPSACLRLYLLSGATLPRGTQLVKRCET